ncbi:MAG: hypothetical protein GY845_15630 [Planctomycetes bacterium]|nr:hypothetical protein [Planctomycetota bacterium]
MRENSPLAQPETAYGDLNEKQYKAEVELADRYQGFTTELVRLSLLGIAVFGFLYKEVFWGFDSKEHPNIQIDCVKELASWSIFLFGICTLFALVFRYFSAESTRYYIEGLRFFEAGKQDKARLKLKKRNSAVIVCIVSKAGAVLCLAVGAMLVAWVFIKLLA